MEPKQCKTNLATINFEHNHHLFPSQDAKQTISITHMATGSLCILEWNHKRHACGWWTALNIMSSFREWLVIVGQFFLPVLCHFILDSVCQALPDINSVCWCAVLTTGTCLDQSFLCVCFLLLSS